MAEALLPTAADAGMSGLAARPARTSPALTNNSTGDDRSRRRPAAGGTIAALVALIVIVASAALLRPHMAQSTGAAAILDRTAGETPPPQRVYIPFFLTMIDFERLVRSDGALPRPEYVPVLLTVIDFDRAFGSVTVKRRDNTPPNRERLRNAGWKRVLRYE